MGKPLAPADHAWLRHFRQLGLAAMHNPAFAVPQWAAAAGVKQRTLYRKTNALTGLTPATLLRQLRLDQARRLLETGTGQSVAGVAFAVGFDDPAYFAKAFYKYHGQRASAVLRQATEVR